MSVHPPVTPVHKGLTVSKMWVHIHVNHRAVMKNATTAKTAIHAQLIVQVIQVGERLTPAGSMMEFAIPRKKQWPVQIVLRAIAAATDSAMLARTVLIAQ